MRAPSCWRPPAACAPATASTCCRRRRSRSPPRREPSRAAWERRRRRFTWPRRIPWRRRRSPVACAIRGRCWHEGLGIRRQRRYGRARPGPLHEAPDRGDRRALPRNDGSVVRRGGAARRHRRGGTKFRRRLLARAGPRGAQASRRRGARRRILRRAFLPQRPQPRLAGSRLPAGKADPPRRFADGERGNRRDPEPDHRGDARLRADPRPPHADGPRRRAAGASREAMQYDLLIKNVRVVRPNEHGVREADIAVKGEKFFTIENGLDVEEAKSVYDGKGWLAFPGVEGEPAFAVVDAFCFFDVKPVFNSEEFLTLDRDVGFAHAMFIRPHDAHVLYEEVVLHRFSRCASSPPSRTICMRWAGIASQASVSPVVKFRISPVSAFTVSESPGRIRLACGQTRAGKPRLRALR